MKILTFGFDDRAVTSTDGHSARWNRRAGERLQRLDVIVEQRRACGPFERTLSHHAHILPVTVPHPLLYPGLAVRRAVAEHHLHHYDLVLADDAFRAGAAALLFQTMTGVPFCLEYHTDTFFNDQWRAERPMIHAAYLAIGREVVRRAASIRCVNHKNEREILRLLGGHDTPVEVIPVPTDFYEPQQHDAAAQQLRRQLLAQGPGPLLLYVGRLAPVKKVDELITVIARLQQRHPTARLVIVGDGGERERLEQQASAQASQAIRFVGYVPEREVWHYYGACDLFVNPAHVEPYGRVYIEAMSAGKAVVTTSGAGAVEDGLCVHQQTALVSEPGDLEQLERHLDQLMADGELRERLGQAGNRAVREHWSYQRSLDRMVALWERSVQRAGAARPRTAAENRRHRPA